MEILKVMVDALRGNHGNYSKAETSQAIREAIVEMNGGSTKINVKKFYRGSELYNLVEELVQTIVNEGWKDEDPIFKLVEYKNIKDGDEAEFHVKKDELFIVANAAAGIKGVRRQRIDTDQSVRVETELKLIRVYDELNRFLSGKVDFNDMVDAVAKSMKQAVLESAYKVLQAITSNTVGLGQEYVAAGAAATAEEALLTLISHVEAATGKPATIFGTKAALRKIPNAVLSDEAKSDLYNMGYYGKFYGADIVSMNQLHKAGTNTFALDDTKVYVVASEDKPVKIVNEGEGILIEKNAADNNDLTQEYIYGQLFGAAFICGAKMGVFTFSA